MFLVRDLQINCKDNLKYWPQENWLYVSEIHGFRRFYTLAYSDY